MRVLWDTTQSSTSLPFSSFNFVLPLSLFLFLHWSILSKLLIQGSSCWWNSFFHGLFLNGWRLLSPLLLCLPLHLHGEKSPLKHPIEARRSSLYRSPTSKLPSPSFSTFCSLSTTFSLSSPSTNLLLLVIAALHSSLGLFFPFCPSLMLHVMW